MFTSHVYSQSTNIDFLVIIHFIDKNQVKFNDEKNINNYYGGINV